MTARWKRVASRSMHAANRKDGYANALKKKRASTDVHAQIQRDAQRVQELIRNIPGYRPCAQDAPHILKLVRTAVRYVNRTVGEQMPRFFVYRGRRYPLSFTNLGRVIVYDRDGNQLGSSNYWAVD